MKKLLLNISIIYAVMLLGVTLAEAHYGPRGLTGGTIVCATEFNNVAFMGTEEGGVYILNLTPANTWRTRAVGLKSGKTTALTHSGEFIYVSTADEGVFVFNGSAGGNDLYWNERNNGLTDKRIHSLLAVDSNTLYAGSESGLFKSSNKGMNWTQINNANLDNQVITNLVVMTNGRLVAATKNTGLFFSDDNGMTWNSMNDNNTSSGNIVSMSYNSQRDELAVSDGNSIFVLGAASLVSTFSYISANANLPAGVNIRNVTNDGNHWFLATSGGVFHTSAQGPTNWVSDNQGLPTMDVNVVLSVGNLLYVGTNRFGVFRSEYSPINWINSNDGMHGISNIKTSSVAGLGDSITFTATEYGAVFSSDFGNSPQIRNNGLTDSLNINDIEFMDNYSVAATSNGGVFWSTDFGLNWSAINGGLTNLNIKKLFYSNDYKYLIDSEGKIFRSEISATSWSAYHDGINASNKASAMAFYADIQFVSTDGGVYRKTIHETEWQLFSNGLTNLNVTAIAASSGKIYAGTAGDGIFISELGAANWSAVNQIQIAHFNDVPFLDPSHIHYMTSYSGYLIASFKGGVAATVNEGNTWIRGGHQFHLPSFADIPKIAFINSRIMVCTPNNSMLSNSLNEFSFIDSILMVSSENANFEKEGGVSYHTITSNLDWEISVSEPWLTVDIQEGFGNKNIKLIANENTGSLRTATVTITGDQMVKTISVSQDGPLSVESIGLNHQGINIYPNPSSGNFNLEVNQLVKINKVIVTDVSGRAIHSTFDENNLKISLDDGFQAGVYFIQLYSESGLITKRVVIK